MESTTQEAILMKERLTKVEAGLDGVRTALGQVDKTLQQVVDLMAAQVRNTEQIKTLYRIFDGMEADFRGLKATVSDVDKTMAEWKPIIESLSKDHDATTQNAIVSRGIFVALRIGATAAVSTVAGYIAGRIAGK